MAQVSMVMHNSSQEHSKVDSGKSCRPNHKVAVTLLFSLFFCTHMLLKMCYPLRQTCFRMIFPNLVIGDPYSLPTEHHSLKRWLRSTMTCESPAWTRRQLSMPKLTERFLLSIHQQSHHRTWLSTKMRFVVADCSSAERTGHHRPFRRFLPPQSNVNGGHCDFENGHFSPVP